MDVVGKLFFYLIILVISPLLWPTVIGWAMSDRYIDSKKPHWGDEDFNQKSDKAYDGGMGVYAIFFVAQLVWLLCIHIYYDGEISGRIK